MYNMNVVLQEIYLCALMTGMTAIQNGHEIVFEIGASKCLKVVFDEKTGELQGQRCIVGLELNPIFAPGIQKPVDFSSCWSEQWETI